MSVVATNAYSTATGNGATTSFPFTFAARNVADVAVYVNSVLQTAGFSVTLNAGYNGGTVVFTTAPAAGAIIIMASSPSFAQSIEFINAGAYNPAMVDGVADAAAIRSIFLQGLLNRSPLVPIGDTLSPLPKASSRANMVFGFDTNGNPLMYVTPLPAMAQAFQIYRFTYTSGPQTFTLPVTPSGVQEVFRNGIVVDENDWSISGATITIGAGVALLNGDIIRVRSAQTAINPPTLNANSVTFTQAGSGAVARTALAKLQERISVIDFGAIGNADECSAAFQKAVNQLGAAGGVIEVPPGEYHWATPVVANGPILFHSSFGDVSSNTNGSDVVGMRPVIYWTGAAGATMLKFTPPAVGQVIFGGGAEGITFDGADVAAIGVAFDNCVASVFDGEARRTTTAGVDVSSDSGSTTNFSQRVQIRRLNFVYGTVAAVQGSHGLRIRGNGTNVPGTQHEIGQVSGLVYNGNLVDVAETDNMRIGKVHGNVQTGGTGKAIKFRAGGAQNANFNVVRYLAGPKDEDAACIGNRFVHFISEGGGFTGGGLWHGDLLDYVTGSLYGSHRYELQKKINVAAGDWVGDGASGLGDLGLQWRALTLSHGVTSSASAIVIDDFDLDNGTISGIEITVGTNGTSAGNYRLHITCSSAPMASAGAVVTPQVDNTATYPAPAQYQTAKLTLTFGSSLSYTKGNAIYLRVQRIGADALDSNTDAMFLLGARILYKSNGPNSAGSGTYAIPNW